MSADIEGQKTHIRGLESAMAVIIDADEIGVSVCIFTRGAHCRAVFTKDQAQAMIEALQIAMEVPV